jgi:signal transduction histidine kinase
MNYSDISILLVEDNPGDARLIKEVLKETDYRSAQFHTAGTLKEAKEAPLQQRSVATVLLDLNLPDSDGIETLISLRSKYPDSAIIVLTGLDDDDMAVRALREGAQSYMTKDEMNASLLGRTLRYSIERLNFIHRLREEEQLSAELQANETLMRAALESEKELNALKSRFIATVSHEFRTPLAIIQGSIDLIDRYAGGSDVQKVKAHVSRIRMKVSTLTSMLNDVLSAETLDQKALKVVPSMFDPVALCTELTSELRTMLRTGQRLKHVHSGEPGPVSLDRQLTINVLNNLLSNAIKYSPEGGTIELRSWLDGERLKLSVRDHGIGIPREEQDLLFERFYRGSNAAREQGTGLGLSIVKQYLELMGGSIRFTSVPGDTVFEVELPRYSG